MTRHSKVSLVCILIFIITVAGTLHAEIITDKDFNFSLDLPEGYQIENYTEDGMSYIFSHPNIPVTLALKIYYNPAYKSAGNVLQMALEKLKAQYETQNFKWCQKSCSISNFTMQLDKKYTGWSVCAPSTVQNAFITLICYAPDEHFQACQQFIMSSLNSLCIDNNYYTPGIITSYAYPSEGKKSVTVKINDKTISSYIDVSDIEASKFLIDLEFGVFSLYTKMPNWKEAWQRYYRMIYRDSYGRLQNFSNSIYKKLYPEAESENPQNPDITYAQYLLSWVQSFDYKRELNQNKSDFTSLPAVLCGEGNDCDSRSMLVAVLLNSIGIDSIMLISRDYSHAVAGTSVKAPGQTYIVEDTKKEYLFGETTAKVTWGMISQNQTDRAKWIPVILP